MSKMGASYLAKTVAKIVALPGCIAEFGFFSVMLEHVGTTVFFNMGQVSHLTKCPSALIPLKKTAMSCLAKCPASRTWTEIG